MNKYDQARLEDVVQPGKRIVFYARYSTEKQEYDMQKHSVETFLQRYGCQIYKEYVDRATSAIKVPFEKREDLQNLIRDAEKGKFDVVITYKNDRIARRIEEHQLFREKMRALNIHVVVSSSSELYTVGEVVSQAVKDGLTRIEAALIQDRTKDTFRRKTKKGTWLGANAQYVSAYRV